MDGPSVLQQLRPKLLLQLKPRAHGLEAPLFLYTRHAETEAT